MRQLAAAMVSFDDAVRLCNALQDLSSAKVMDFFACTLLHGPRAQSNFNPHICALNPLQWRRASPRIWADGAPRRPLRKVGHVAAVCKRPASAMAARTCASRCCWTPTNPVVIEGRGCMARNLRTYCLCCKRASSSPETRASPERGACSGGSSSTMADNGSDAVSLHVMSNPCCCA